jgi:hypothetical protein
MIFLFEQFAYSSEYLKKVLPTDKEGRFAGLPNGFVQNDGKLDGVGYLYNKSAKKNAEKAADNIVFVLPKVFMDDAKTAFGEVVNAGKDFSLDAAPKEFLSKLSLWVCSSIDLYHQQNPKARTVDVPEVFRFGSAKESPTLINVMNAMKAFYAENQNLFVFTAKNKHSGNNRIDWRRTVAHTQPFMQNGAPIYMELENKKKVFDLDDRLLVLYFSAMNYIEETFGFKMPKSEFYAPIRVNEFRRLLGHRGLVELRRIKHKYFADKFLKLFNIVKAFFEWGANFSANDFSNEYMLTNKYNNVFESMIDKLVGDDLPHSMNYLKAQKDGKVIDHLYKDRQLIFADEEQKIWFVGDSKYYKDGNKIEGNSIYKQFTYAKNIIQYNISDLLEKDQDRQKYQGLRYRDELTEGYSVTPNFFIRGFLPSSEKDSLKKEEQFRESYFRTELTDDQLIANEADSSNYQLVDDEGNVIGDAQKDKSLWDLRNRHFKNRLFDRDTLLLQVYNVNFLYVLKAYTSKRSSLRDEFKGKARDMFRRNFLDLLNRKYYFWALYLPDLENKEYPKNFEDFLDRNFRSLVGRVFQPVGTPLCLILALEQDVVNETLKPNQENDYKKIRQIVAKEKCEVFQVWPNEIWDSGTPQKWNDDNLRKVSAPDLAVKKR